VSGRNHSLLLYNDVFDKRQQEDVMYQGRDSMAMMIEERLEENLQPRRNPSHLAST
jgi:hypothetical protein